MHPNWTAARLSKPMRIGAAIFALAVGACEPEPVAPAALAPVDTPAVAAPEPEPTAVDLVVDRAWMRTVGDGGAPGAMRVFLSSGQTLSVSCAEPPRLSSWRRLTDQSLSFIENAADVTALVVLSEDGGLSLELRTKDGSSIERFEPAATPYICTQD